VLDAVHPQTGRSWSRALRTVGRTYMVAEDDVKRLASRQDGGRLRKRSTGHKEG
jgi:hypothetical protein